jgi:hypothetical protein
MATISLRVEESVIGKVRLILHGEVVVGRFEALNHEGHEGARRKCSENF